jgi:hypothetical protein
MSDIRPISAAIGSLALPMRVRILLQTPSETLLPVESPSKMLEVGEDTQKLELPEWFSFAKDLMGHPYRISLPCWRKRNQIRGVWSPKTFALRVNTSPFQRQRPVK